MAKRSKVTKGQRSRELIQAARYAKSHGLLSKLAKLHSGKYVSKRVATKVRKMLPEIEKRYVGVKVPRTQARATKEQGYLVVLGNRIISPNAHTATGRAFQKRLKSGLIGGVKPLRSGHMESIVMPHDIYDMRSLVENYKQDANIINGMKEPDELFMFKLYGNESYRPFLTIESLMDYLLRYKSLFDAAGDLRAAIMEDTFENFQIFKISPYDVRTVIRTREERERERGPKKRSKRAKQERSEYRLRTARLKAKRFRASLTGEAREEYLRKARARVNKARNKEQ